MTSQQKDIAPLLTHANQTKPNNNKCKNIYIISASIIIIALIITIIVITVETTDSSSLSTRDEYVPTIKLSNAASSTSYMPVIGLGTGGYSAAKSPNISFDPQYWDPEQGYNHTLKWLKLWTDYGDQKGIIRFDSAEQYRSKTGVARAIVEYTQNYTKIPREKIFITSKTGLIEPLGYNETFSELNKILTKFNTTYIDLLLIHFPSYFSPSRSDSDSIYCNNIDGNNTDYSPSKCRKTVWKAYEEIFDSGRAKAIGVSNFAIKHLNDTFLWNDGKDEDDESLNIKYLPSVNQIEFHGYYHNHNLVEFCQKYDITVNGYSSLGAPDITLDYWTGDTPLLIYHPIAEMIGERYNKSAAQIWLKWSYQQGIVINPRSMVVEHQLENINIFDEDWELTQQEMLQLSTVKAPDDPIITRPPESMQ